MNDKGSKIKRTHKHILLEVSDMRAVRHMADPNTALAARMRIANVDMGVGSPREPGRKDLKLRCFQASGVGAIELPFPLL